MGYSAGDLSVELFGIDTNAVASIDNTAKALKKLSSALRSIEKLQSIFIGNKIENIFDSIAKATNSINTTNIERLASASKSLASISKISKLQDLDYGKIGQGFASLTTAITPFIDKIRTAEASLVALYGTLSKAKGKKIRNLLGENTEPTRPKGSGLFSAIGLTAVLHVARRLGRVVANIAQSGADYTETLNLWETAMTRNLDQATAFVKKMNEAYGISEKTLMNAQATFKNMLGSLGQISESTAYALSEGITQMAIDYASLYNVNFEKAFEKFQSALAGQVRPIRSVSGYDITENTIFELYKQLGGEKSVRNLSRTEKQLLAILAVFNQMQASGAVGDLNKTMESFANQSRVMAEAWNELASYAGILLTYLIQESGILTWMTAQIIALGKVLKMLANETGAIKSFGGDIFGGVTDSAEGASDAIDKLNGKLLDFDKFRALNESEDAEVAIDEKLLQGLSQYTSILENATNNATELASKWTKDLSVEDVKAFARGLDNIFQLLLSIVSSGVIMSIVKGITALTTAGAGLSNILLTGIIYAILQAIEAFKNGDVVVGIIATTIAVVLVGALIAYKIATANAKKGLDMFNTALAKNDAKLLTNASNTLYLANSLKTVAVIVTTAISAFMIFDGILQGLSGTAKQTVSIIMIVAGALATILGLILAIKGGVKGGLIGATVAGLGVGALVAGIKGVATSQFANGGLPDKGTMFVAGEAGAEMVYNMPSGQSGVANIQQIAQANYNGTIKALNDWWGGMSAKQDIPKLQGANATGLYQAVTGVAKAQGERWSKY